MSLDIIKDARSRWNHIEDPRERAVRTINTAAAMMGGGEAGWGLFAKSGGEGWTYKGTRFSLDLMFNRITREGYDVLRDAEDTGTPVWSKKTIKKMEDWLHAWRPPVQELLPEGVPALTHEEHELRPEQPTPPLAPITDLRPVLDAILEVARGVNALSLQVERLNQSVHKERGFTGTGSLRGIEIPMSGKVGGPID
jgi:hypothetical protein